MKWKTHTPFLSAHSRRSRHFFAWLPVDICGDTYWLEYVHVVEEWVPPSGGDATQGCWRIVSQGNL